MFVTDRHRFMRVISVALTALIVTTFSADAGRKKKPGLKVVILAGQSNMQAPAISTTLAGLADSPETKDLYNLLIDDMGKVRAWPKAAMANRQGTFPHGIAGNKVKERGSNYGPEYGFGVALTEKLQEPVLIIKTAWGGKTLFEDFRPPIAEEWVPPEGHPDHPDMQPDPIPIPKDFRLPKGFEPPKGGNNMQICTGGRIGKMHGIYPAYVISAWDREELAAPFKVGDILLGLNGAGFREDPVNEWRYNWFVGARKGDWKIDVALYRDGKVQTVEVDVAAGMEGGRANHPQRLEELAAAKKKLKAEGGEYYRMMMQTIKEVLSDPGKHHPTYRESLGYEIAGFVWFQGFNDKKSSIAYPNQTHPRGYEYYSWLLSHFIRSVRADLEAPEMPFVVGVFGQGGILEEPCPFREAQAAVADYDEFKGTVRAVRTAPFVDTRIGEVSGKYERVMAYDGKDPNHPYAKLQAKVRKLREKMLAEAGDLEKMPEKHRGRLEGMIRKACAEAVKTPEEIEFLKNNISNQGFHYSGSPKFFVRAGMAFGETLGEMIQQKAAAEAEQAKKRK